MHLNINSFKDPILFFFMVSDIEKIIMIEEAYDLLKDKTTPELIKYQKQIQPKGLLKWLNIYSPFKTRYEDLAINILIKQRTEKN